MSRWDEYKQAMGSTTNTSGASYYSGNDSFDAYQRYRSQMLGKEFEESEAERKRREKELERLKKHNDDYEKRQAEGIATWGDDALGANKPQLPTAASIAAEEAKKQQDLMEGKTKPSIQIAAGAANATGNPEIEKNEVIREFQNWDASKQKDDPKFARIPSEEKYKMFVDEVQRNIKESAYSNGYRTWLNNQRKGDPYFDRMSDAEKERQYMMTLDQTVKDNGTLPEEQRAELTEYKYNHLTDREKRAIDAVMRIESEEFEEAQNGSEDTQFADPTGRGNWSQKRYQESQKALESKKAANERTLEDIKKELKHLGWSDKQIETELARYRELVDYRKVQEGLASQERMVTDPNLTDFEKAMLGAGYTAADWLTFMPRSLQAVKTMPGISYLTGNEGAYGRNTSSKDLYLSRMAEGGVSQVANNLIGEEHPWGQEAYNMAVSAGESVSAALMSAALGPAGENLSLIPFASSAYDSGYRDAINRGFSENQAQAYGVVVGGLEAATEKLPLDRLKEVAKGNKIGRNIITTALMSMGIEGTEEVASELGQAATDYIAVNVGKTGKTQYMIDVENYMSQGMDEEEAKKQAMGDFAGQVLSAFVSGAGSAGMSTAVAAGAGALNRAVTGEDGRIATGEKINKAIADRYDSLEIKGDSEYEKALQADKEKYQNNPTQFVADQYKAEDKDGERIKKALQDIADKEKEGKKLSMSDKAFIAENAQVGKEFIEKLYDIGEDSAVPYKYRDVKTELSEDDARRMLAQAAKDGNTQAFLDAMEKTRNSSIESVAQNAEQIISDYSGMAQNNGITKEDMGKAVLAQKQAYIAGLKGEELNKDQLTDKAKIAYNDGMQKYLENKTRTTVSSQEALKSAVVNDADGNTVRLTGSFDADGKIKTSDGKSVSVEDLKVTDESMAAVKAYSYADNFKNVNTKNEFLKGIKDNTVIKEYAQDWQKDYDLAMSGVSDENIKQGFSRLDDVQRQSAIDAGRRDARIKATNEINKAWGVVHKAEGIFYNEAEIGDKKMIQFYDNIASKLGINIRMVKDVAKGSRGNFDSRTNTITVDARKAITLYHEIGEFSETYNKEGYDELKHVVADLSAKKFGADAYHKMLTDYSNSYSAFSRNVVEKQGGKALDTEADEMSGEMFNDVICAMLSTDKGAKAFAEYLAGNFDSSKAKTLGQKAADVVKNLANAIKKLVDPNKNELSGNYQKAVYQIADELADHADKFIKVLDKAVQNYQSMAVEGAGEGEEKFSIKIANGNVEYVDVDVDSSLKKEMDKVTSPDSETVRFSVETYKSGGESVLKEYLENYSGLTKKDQKDIIDTLDWGYSIAKDLAEDKKYKSFGKWSKTGLVMSPDGTPMIEVIGSNGKPVQSVAVNNGEYPLNIDFSQVCKKRVALNAVLNQLVSDADLNIRMLTESDIAGINALIKEHQFEIACGLCFVDSKRYRVGSWADSFVNGQTDDKTKEHKYGWNDLVKSMIKKGVSAQYVPLSANHVKPLGNLLQNMDDKDVDFKLINKIIKPYLKTDKNGNQTIGQAIINGEKSNPTEDVRMAWLLKTNPATRMLLDKNDIIASEGLDALRVKNKEIYALVNAHGGTSKPKLSHGATAYGNEVIRSAYWGSANDFNKENAYAVGGVRVQSFSDYVANMFFDYMQMFADMSARELPSHAYTKEINYVKLFGMTGQRINMSLIFKGANLTEEQQERYEKLAKKGRSALMKDPEFKALAEHAGLDEKGNYIYEDESFPAEEAYKLRKDPRYKNCGTIAVGLSDAHIRKLLADPQIDMVIPYHSSGVSGIIKAARNLALYTDYTKQQNTRKKNGEKLEKGDYDWYANLKSEINPKGMTLEETVKDYLKWCDQHGYLPVFDQFRNEEGYWKLLVDFRSYDNNGKFMPQGKVTMNFPAEKEFKAIVQQSLKDQQESEDRLQKELDPEQDALYSEVKKFLEKKGAIEPKYSVEIDSEGNNLTEGQVEYFKDSKVRDESGSLKVMYHGSPNKFTIFDPKRLGGENGTAEGYGIYFADTQEVTKVYGNEQLKGYLNITHPASSFEKTIKATDLIKLIKATAEAEAQRMVDAGDYDSVDDAIKDSWVSNYEYTYDKPISSVYRTIANDIIRMNSSDMDIIQEVMAGNAVRNYESAYNFYDILTDTLGIDGFITDWTASNGDVSRIAVALYSNQFKNIDNVNPTENEDIRYSLNIENLMDIEIEDLIDDDELDAAVAEEFEKELKAMAETKSPKVKKERARHLLRSMLGSEFDSVDGKKIAFTNDRIDRLLKMFAASNKDYAQAYLTYMSPADYLLLTTNGNDGTRTLDRIKKESTPLDTEELKNVYDTQPIFLDLAEKGVGRATKNEIIGHEGRHRMYALQMAGFNQIPVLVFNYDNKYNKQAIDSISVYPQAFNEDEKYGTNNMIELNNLQPLSRGNEENIRQMFGIGQNADLRLSLDVDSDGKNLTEDQKKYFKDSKAVDDNGNLMVLYHGIGNDSPDFTTFDPRKSGDGLSLFLTDNKNVAKSYGISTHKAYVDVKNPLVLDAKGQKWFEILPEGIENAPEWEEITDASYTRNRVNGEYSYDVSYSLNGKKHTDNGLTREEVQEKYGSLFGNFDRAKISYSRAVVAKGTLNRINFNTRYWSQFARDNGYDGVIIKNVLDENASVQSEESIGTDVIVFRSNQIKLTSNEHPTSADDIRYSIDIDSNGRKLTEGQQKYFNNSKVVDENGALKVMYHGTNKGGFTVFDPEVSDDHTSLFFSDNADVSESYTGSSNRLNPYKFVEINTIEDAIKYMKSIGYKGFTSEDVSNLPDGTETSIEDMESATTRYWTFKDEKGQDYTLSDKMLVGIAQMKMPKNRGIYSVYLNIKNPLVIDAQGSLWSKLSGRAFAKEKGGWVVSDIYAEQTDDGLYDVISDVMDVNLQYASLDDIKKAFDKYSRRVGNQVVEWIKNYGDFDFRNVFINYDIGQFIPNDTRTAAQMAKKGGYDGVIIKNVKDNGGKGMDFEKGNVLSTVAIAFSPEQVKDIDNLNPTSSEDIRYSLDLDAEDEGGWVDFGAIGSTQRTEEQAINILEEGMEALKNQEVDTSKLRTLALKLLNEYGSSYDVKTLTENLQKAFAYMQTEDHVDYKTMMGILKDIAKPVVESSGEKVGEQEYKDFLNYFKGKKIKLTSKQKDEVRYRFGSYGAFRNAVMPIMISDNGDITLDQIWDEMVEQTGFVLDRDANEGDMPLNLMDTLQAIKPTVRNDFGGDIDDVSKDLAMRIVEEYIEGESAKQMHKEVMEYRAKLKKDYQDRLKDLKGRANAEVLARNKRRLEQSKERDEVRRLKNEIRVSANKLFTWVEKPTEGKSVPHNMMVPVTQFLQAIDFVDPVIMQGEDGKWHTRVLDHYDVEDGHAKNFVYKDIVGDTYEDALNKFNEEIGRGKGSKDQRTWADKMQGIREIYDKVLRDSDFEDTSMDFLMQTLDAQGLTEEFDELLAKNKGQVNMNHLDSKDLTLINNIIKNIFHALNQGNRAYSSNIEITDLARSTMQDAEGKELKERGKFMEAMHSFLRINNATPRTFFKLLGRRGSEVYQFLRKGLNQEIQDIKKASDFMKGVMDGVDAKKWTGDTATVHEFSVNEGSVRLTDAQIMGLYCLVRRKGGMERISEGIVPDEIQTKGLPIRQGKIKLTPADIAKIEAVLTPEQVEIANKMQKYMANDCSAMGNEVSLKLYGYKKFTDETYYPWTVDKDMIPTNNTSENIPMFTSIERSGFTKQLKKEAKNPLLIRDIFDVFSDHVSQMAAYHGYAAPVKDTLRWMNYRDADWGTNKQAIKVLSGSRQGVGYITTLLLDINKANKSQYIGNFTEALMGNYKAAAVGANARVILQQPTAYFRALNQIDAKYLMSVNPTTAIKNIKTSQEECPISWWKSKGYYETNLGQPIREIVTGISSTTEAIKDKLMAPAGWADDVTWGFLYTAVENEQRALHKGEKITPEQFRQMVNDRFDEVVDNTQVVDSTLHRSAFMRSKDKLNIIQTAFMAEPTKTYNMLMESLLEDLHDEKKTLKRFTRASAAFAITAIINAAAQSLVDVPRHAGDDDDWWETFKKYWESNIQDNVNPFNLLPIVKEITPDLFNLFSGETSWNKGSSRFDVEAVDTIINAASTWIKFFQGESNKTFYGMFMATIKPLSQMTGIPVYNLTRDSVALYNAFFDNLETTIQKGNPARTEAKKDVVSVVDKRKDEDVIEESITDAINKGVSIYDLKGSLKSEYKNKYFEAYSEGDMEKAKSIADKAAGGFAVMGMTDEEIDDEINDWQEEAITYSKLDKAIADGEGIVEEIRHVQEGKADDKIIDHIMDRFASTVQYEDSHETESEWRKNVETALQAVDPTTTFNSAKEEADRKAKEKAENAEQTAHNQEMKADFFDAVEKMDGSAGRKALEVMKKEGMEAKTVKSAVSTRYHDEWKEAKKRGDTAGMSKAKSSWKSAYTLVNNVYNSKSNDLDKTWSDWEKDQK